MYDNVREAMQSVICRIADRIGITPAWKNTLNCDDRSVDLAIRLGSADEEMTVLRRGLTSIFDRLWLKEGEAVKGNKLFLSEDGRCFECRTSSKESDLKRLKQALDLSSDPEYCLDALKKYASDLTCIKDGELSVYLQTRLSSAFASAMSVYYQGKFPADDETAGKENCLVLYTADFSGIQNFIYTIIQMNALKMLRARSFFVELVMAHLTAELTETFGVTQANVLYSGGGHCYVLLPAVSDHLERINRLHKALNDWCIEYFSNSLSVVWECCPCCPDDFLNEPDGSYQRLFKDISAKMAKRKLSRYSADDLIKLNTGENKNDGKRECSICGAASNTVKVGNAVCEWCEMFTNISQALIDGKKCFCVTDKKTEGSVPFFSYNGTAYFSITDKSRSSALISDKSTLRLYFVNGLPEDIIDRNKTAALEVCGYSVSDVMRKLSISASGIKRIGVLRMDVDNLGSTFISGFDKACVNIGRTAALSSMIAGFFKNNLNAILSRGGYNITVLYAGGDDVFLAGSWDDVIEAAKDTINAFRKYTDGKLTISGGIGLYKDNYPVVRFARHTELLEACSKSNLRKSRSKDSVTLFSDDHRHTYFWDEFEKAVTGEKLGELEDFMKKDNNGLGNSFLYQLLEFLRGLENDKINIARAAYLLGRLSLAVKNQNSSFPEHVYSWISDKESREDVRQLITAITIYIYQKRRSNNGQKK